MTNTRGHRDPKTGRFARPPLPDVDAESEFDPMGDSIPFVDVSGAPSANTIDRPRYAPAGDELAQGGSRFPLLHRRHPVLVAMDERAATQYGTQGMLTRDAARLSGISGALGYVLGIDGSEGSSSGVQAVTDDMPGVQDVPGVLRPASRGLGRARER